MYEFKDYYQNIVQFFFDDQFFLDSLKYVWVICCFGGKWFLIEYEDRGYEFSGGKVELMECVEEVVFWEVKEEMGVRVKSFKYFGQYKVFGKEKVIVKNIYFVVIEKFEK